MVTIEKLCIESIEEEMSINCKIYNFSDFVGFILLRIIVEYQSGDETRYTRLEGNLSFKRGMNVKTMFETS